MKLIITLEANGVTETQEVEVSDKLLEYQKERSFGLENNLEKLARKVIPKFLDKVDNAPKN